MEFKSTLEQLKEATEELNFYRKLAEMLTETVSEQTKAYCEIKEFVKELESKIPAQFIYGNDVFKDDIEKGIEACKEGIAEVGTLKY